MKKIALSFIVPSFLLLFLWSCQKSKNSNDGAPPLSASFKGPVSLYMTDYYPDSFYHRYATLLVSSDSTNLYLHVNTLHDFQFNKIRILIGNFDHVKNVLAPFTTPPLNEAGPSSSDYTQDYGESGLPSTYDLTIPRASLNATNVYIYVWTRVVKLRPDGSEADWHGSWPYSKQQINGDAATSYFGYNME